MEQQLSADSKEVLQASRVLSQAANVQASSQPCIGMCSAATFHKTALVMSRTPAAARCQMPAMLKLHMPDATAVHTPQPAGMHDAATTFRSISDQGLTQQALIKTYNHPCNTMQTSHVSHSSLSASPCPTSASLTARPCDYEHDAVQPAAVTILAPNLAFCQPRGVQAKPQQSYCLDTSAQCGMAFCPSNDFQQMSRSEAAACRAHVHDVKAQQGSYTEGVCQPEGMAEDTHIQKAATGIALANNASADPNEAMSTILRSLSGWQVPAAHQQQQSARPQPSNMTARQQESQALLIPHLADRQQLHIRSFI